jgi:hypothetical protein
MISNNQLLFRDWNSVAAGNIASFQLKNASSLTQVWDITNALEPAKVKTTLSGTTLSFVADAGRLREYIAFSDNFLKPVAIGKVNTQNLHATPKTDMLIVTTPGISKCGSAASSLSSATR